MMSIWKIIRNLSAILGGLFLMGAVGTSDYYTMELGQAEPSSVYHNLIIGFVLILPLLVNTIYDMYKEGKTDDVDR